MLPIPPKREGRVILGKESGKKRAKTALEMWLDLGRGRTQDPNLKTRATWEGKTNGKRPENIKEETHLCTRPLPLYQLLV